MRTTLVQVPGKHRSGEKWEKGEYEVHALLERGKLDLRLKDLYGAEVGRREIDWGVQVDQGEIWDTGEDQVDLHQVLTMVKAGLP